MSVGLLRYSRFLTVNESNRRTRGYARAGGANPLGRFVPAGLPRETAVVPGAWRRAAHLSNLPEDIPQKTRRGRAYYMERRRLRRCRYMCARLSS